MKLRKQACDQKRLIEKALRALIPEEEMPFME
jgi:hypothetical protein